MVPSASVADAVISAEAPFEASSARVLASESVSVTSPTSNSSTSVIVTVNVVSDVDSSALVALTVMVQVVPDS